MYPSSVLIIVSVYIIVLFSVAKWGDKQKFIEHSWVRHPVVYALALGVYCTSWTFYGLVGTASEKGWNFLPILLGPILLFLFGFPVLKRIYTVSRQENIHSIADFIASRYGKRQGIAATVSVVVLFATIPYIALQLKAVSDTLLLTLGENFLSNQNLTLAIGLSMIAFALAFGVKRLDMSGYHSGIMLAIAFESIIKLLVIMVVAIFAWLCFSEQDILTAVTDTSPITKDISPFFSQPLSWPRFLVETLLSMCAIFCLPRMFHITFVECLSIQHLKKSRSLFVIYLVIIMICIVIVASVGNTIFLHDATVSGDAYMIALPLHYDVQWIAILAFLGGFSAATAMIIVATITLSQMLSNDVILPLLIRRQRYKKTRSDFSCSLILTRRITVLLVVFAAYFYQGILAENVALTSIGLIAFALIVQLAPAILFGLYWRKGNAHGLYAGLIVGCALWFYTLMIPLLVEAGLIGIHITYGGLFSISWLRPEYLFNWTFSDSFTRGVILSLGANVIFYCFYSLISKENFADKVQSAAFLKLERAEYDYYEGVNLQDLKALLVGFLGRVTTDKLFVDFDGAKSLDDKRQLVDKAQALLASTVGIASSQTMLESLSSGKKIAVEEVVDLFGKTAKAFRFNQEVLAASFENISSGISVVDKDLCLVAWNQYYEDMFKYPKGLLQVGLPVAEILRFNGERGLLGGGCVDHLVHKRMSYMTSGKTYRVIRSHYEEMVIEIKGGPLPNGGYVSTYDDITQFINVQRSLEEANANLEARVQERTQVIAEVNADLLQEIQQRKQAEEEMREAKKRADASNVSKTRFLALASHDISQPLNAANLYASALLDEHGNLKQDANIVKRLQAAIGNTESIISALLEVSKVDSGILQPKMGNINLHAMLTNIIAEMSVQLSSDISIHYVKTSVWVYSDQHYLHRIVQNFISNAIKYTKQGKVLVGCRRVVHSSGQVCVKICVLDNGVGISENEKNAIFDDFYRVSSKTQTAMGDIPGLGLGLSVVARFSELLGHPVACESELHKGSCFSVEVPLVTNSRENSAVKLSAVESSMKGLVVTYVDDEPHNLSATSLLLERWQCKVVTLGSVAEAKEYAANDCRPDVLLMDYQLDQAHVTGIDLANELLMLWRQQYNDGYEVPVCIVSASTEEALPNNVKAAGFQFLRKPVKLGRLRALLTQLKEKRDVKSSDGD